MNMLALIVLVGLALALSPMMASAAEPAAKPRVELETSQGKIVLELDSEKAPITAENFLKYVEKGYFNGLIFHRVIPNFMIQGGGFSPDMTQQLGGLMPPIKNEGGNGLKNDRGTIAMARTNDPDSATAQFFINLKDNDFLNRSPGNPGYAVFGKVVEGMEVVDAIAKTSTTTKRDNRGGSHDDVPRDPIVIKTAKMISAGG